MDERMLLKYRSWTVRCRLPHAVASPELRGWAAITMHGRPEEGQEAFPLRILRIFCKMLINDNDECIGFFKIYVFIQTSQDNIEYFKNTLKY